MARSSSKLFYSNPEINARDDGLCPTRLPDDYTGSINPSDEYIIYCQTNSKLLNHEIQAKDDASVELEFICESISRFVMENVDEEEQNSALISLDFDIDGCIWKMGMNPSVSQPGVEVQVTLLARNDKVAGRLWVTETCLVDVNDGGSIMMKSQLKDLPLAKATLEQTALVIRKAVVRCEFPEFPEGGKGRAFKEVYKLNAKLKSGTFSTICRGTHRVSGRIVAVKCVRRQDLPPEDDAAVFDEVSILSSLSVNPPHIVPLIDFFEDDDTYFLVKELLTGGGVLERIALMGYRYNERIARGVIFNIMEALSFCHARNIAHRDVNSKNLMFVNEDKDVGIKLAGFGFAARCHAPQSLTRQCGTPLFVAPEVLLKKPYGLESDMWSAGCVAFLLLSGMVPFSGSTQKELFRSIVAGRYTFGDEWTEISEEGKQFVGQLLEVNPAKRLRAEEALDHPWMSLADSELNPRILEDASLRIRDFHRKMHPSDDANSN